MALEGVEIAITMKQLMTLDEAEGRDECVNRRADGDAFAPQEPIIVRRDDRDLATADRAEFERRENPLRPTKVVFAPKALQDFGHDQIPNYNGPVGKPFERAGRCCGSTVEIVDPH